MILRRKRRKFAPGWPRLRWRRAVDMVGSLSPVPLLILHGERDWLVHPGQARQLYEAAGPPKELVILPGVAHAEYIMAQNPGLLVSTVREFFERELSGSDRELAAPGDVSLTRGRS